MLVNISICPRWNAFKSPVYSSNGPILENLPTFANGIAEKNSARSILTFIRLLEKYAVRYMIVGGEAVIYHGYPRVTGDVDFFYEPTRKNTEKLWAVLKEFWDGKIPGLRNSAELMEPGLIIQFGRPPHRLDLMNAIDGVSFSAAWRSHLRVQLGKSKDHTSYIGLRTLIKNKRASGRHKDLQDTEHLKKKPGAH